jgi:phage protein D
VADTSSTAVGYTLTIGGRSFEQTANDGLEMLVFEDHVDMVDQLSVRIGGTESQPEWNFNIGDEVECSIGKGEQTIFKGEVTAMEPTFQVGGSTSITIRAMDKMHRLGRGRQTRFWEEMKDSDVASEVGAECGLSVSTDTTEETMPYILQRNESNIAFLKRLAARNNYLVRVVDGSLEFKKASFQGASTSIQMGENLQSVRWNFNSAGQVQQVVVRGWDPSKKESIVGMAGVGDVTAIGGGEVGAQISSKFGDSTAYVTDVPVSSQSMANAIARSEMERHARQFGRGTGRVKGNDALRAGTMIEFNGLSQGLNGSFYVMATRHVIQSQTGYSTEFTFCSNTMGS